MRQNCWGHFVEDKANGIIALFTVILAASTIALWLSTKITAEHIPRVERAYVYGGFGPQANRRADFEKRLLEVGITLANYGKTPAFIISVQIGMAKESFTLPEPEFDYTVPVSDYYFPGMTMKDVRGDTADRVTFPVDDDWIIFGQVNYRDVLGEIRWSRWAFRYGLVGNPGIEGVHWYAPQRIIDPNGRYWANSDT